MKLQIYQDLKKEIESSLPEVIKTVGLFNNQYENEDTERPFNYPALFIEFSSMPYAGETFGVQKCDAEISFHIGFHDLEDVEEIFNITQKVFKAINGFATADMSSLMRINEVQDTGHGNVMVWIQTYRTTITDEESNAVDGKIETTLTTLKLTGDLDIDNLRVRTGDGDF